MGEGRSILSVVRRHAARLKQSSGDTPVRVLVVDDEPPVRAFVSSVLKDAGYAITTAENARDAMRIVAEHGVPDLLLTDLRMPGTSGDELAARLRHDNPDLRVLYLTGFAGELFDHRGTLWKNEAFLDKPCTVRGLLEAVVLAISGHLPGERGGNGGGPKPPGSRDDV